MTHDRDERFAEISDEELAAAAGEPLPDRAAMSTFGFDVSELAIVDTEPFPPMLGPEEEVPIDDEP